MTPVPETRTVPVALLKVTAGMLLLLWLALLVAFVLIDWSFDGPVTQRIAYGLMFAVGFVLPTTAGLLWRTAIGMEPQTSANGARYWLGSIGLVVPAVTLMYMDLGGWAPWRIVALVVLVLGIAVLWVLDLRDRRRHKGEIVAPIVAMTVRTHVGDREVRVAQPEGLHDRWMTRWSVGTPECTVQRVSYGPDAMRSLTAALADAEAATVVI